ncbi:hypothetical protein Ferp_0571 [Ferroglobus placidus DSM 10642]|uniref:Uncharacterized protein n=1 Tax=Ferroglobus placidus (strain DSM 10642 / AEDII12DO) TaxID=589924 RepID=D3S3B1_FERPA|nr:hypothetical protein [Ferroglobus placidus]ADC64744.1 hypothetical protein Ferp_0571 [Ferroglobus placidus DSM 10642]
MRVLKKTQFPKRLRGRIENEKQLRELVFWTVEVIPKDIKRKLGLQVREWRERLAEMLFSKHRDMVGKDWVQVVSVIEDEIISGRFKEELEKRKLQEYEENKRLLESVESRIGRRISINPNIPGKVFITALTEQLTPLVDVKVEAPLLSRALSNDLLEELARYYAQHHIWVLVREFIKGNRDSLSIEVVLEKPFMTYCPICKDFAEGSEYLYEEAFPDDYFAYWIANLVKHYRHEHIRYYDLSWRYWSYGDKNPEYQKLGHDGFRITVNNRAKRQLIRAILKDENLSAYGKRELILAVLRLQHNDEKTVELVKKALQKIEQADEEKF